MSGKAYGHLRTHRFEIMLESSLQVNIATTPNPDGSVSGPAEYFAREQQALERWLQGAASDLERAIAPLSQPALQPANTVELRGSLPESVHGWTLRFSPVAPLGPDDVAALGAAIAAALLR